MNEIKFISRIRKLSHSNYVITIPKKIIDLNDFKNGDYCEIEIISVFKK